MRCTRLEEDIMSKTASNAVSNRRFMEASPGFFAGGPKVFADIARHESVLRHALEGRSSSEIEFALTTYVAELLQIPATVRPSNHYVGAGMLVAKMLERHSADEIIAAIKRKVGR